MVITLLIDIIKIYSLSKTTYEIGSRSLSIYYDYSPYYRHRQAYKRYQTIQHTIEPIETLEEWQEV